MYSEWIFCTRLPFQMWAVTKWGYNHFQELWKSQSKSLMPSKSIEILHQRHTTTLHPGLYPLDKEVPVSCATSICKRVISSPCITIKQMENTRAAKWLHTSHIHPVSQCSPCVLQVLDCDLQAGTKINKVSQQTRTLRPRSVHAIFPRFCRCSPSFFGWIVRTYTNQSSFFGRCL